MNDTTTTATSDTSATSFIINGKKYNTSHFGYCLSHSCIKNLIDHHTAKELYKYVIDFVVCYEHNALKILTNSITNRGGYLFLDNKFDKILGKWIAKQRKIETTNYEVLGAYVINEMQNDTMIDIYKVLIRLSDIID